MQVNLPFRYQFRDKMLRGLTTLASRTRRYGKAGDTFIAFGATFTILDVQERTLKEVAYMLYVAEGFDSPREFILCWNELHPRRRYDPEQKVYTHAFKKGAELCQPTALL
jgi:hypothetical protein